MSRANDSDEHRCQWLECTLLCDDAQSLYEHVTSTHIGRKSAGTLSLECKWAGCNAKALKRDHLTSHARVHINLKPHACSVCNKAFKRPQDLKKHEKIHTEEHHAHHKHSKAVTVGTSPNDGTGSDPVSNGAPNVPVGFPGYPYPYPYFGQPIFPGHPPAPLSQMDVSQIIEQQRQLNAHVLNSAQFGLPYGMPGYPNPGQYGNPQAMASMPMFAPGMPAPYSYPFYHPQAPQQANLQLPTPLPSSTATSASQSSPNVQASLYPTLPQLGSAPTSTGHNFYNASAQPQYKQDISSPASPYSAYSSVSGQSPNVPALSPASQTLSHSPSPASPERDVDSSLFRRVTNTNAVAGQKRAFEDAAGEFFADIKNKRFQEDDLSAQVDSIDALALLLTPNDFASPNFPVINPYDKAAPPSINSDFNRTDVEHINDILANLAQNLDDFDHKTLPDMYGHTNAHASRNSNVSTTQMPLYPSLSSFDHRPMASLPSRVYQQDSDNALASVRLSKAPAAPTLAANENRVPQYHHMERLMRAAPTSSFREYRRANSMDVEEEDVRPGKGYSASLRSTSLDVDTREDEEKPILPALNRSRASSIQAGPTLSPMLSSPPQAKKLPHLSDLLAAASEERPSSLYPIVASSVPTSESVSASSRPTSSSGMDRLVPKFTKMEIPSDCEESEHEDEASTTSSGKSRSPVHSHSHSESSDEEEMEHSLRSKKSRFESPGPMESEETDEAAAAAASQEENMKARRLAVVRALVIYANDMYRRRVASQMAAAREQVAA